MKIEQQVISLELARKLKELGVKQESVWVWAKQAGENSMGNSIIYSGVVPKSIVFRNDILCVEEEICSAFTVAELGEMLPASIFENNKEWELRCWKNSPELFQIGYVRKGEPFIVLNSYAEFTEANARAKMLIYLIENKLQSKE